MSKISRLALFVIGVFFTSTGIHRAHAQTSSLTMVDSGAQGHYVYIWGSQYVWSEGGGYWQPMIVGAYWVYDYWWETWLIRTTQVTPGCKLTLDVGFLYGDSYRYWTTPESATVDLYITCISYDTDVPVNAPVIVIPSVACPRILRDPAGGSAEYSNLSGSNASFYIGERVNLRFDPNGVDCVFGGWQIDGRTFADYQAGNASATLTQVPPSALANTDISLYWASGGAKPVRAMYSTNSGNSHSVSATADVKAPIFNSSEAPLEFRLPGAPMIFGDLFTVAQKMDVQAKVTTDPTHTGAVCAFVQKCNVDFHYENAIMQYKVTDKAGQWLLDTSFPAYAASNNGGTFPVDGLNRAYFSDGPGMFIQADGARSLGMYLQFQLYLIFKPGGTDSRWVPLYRWDWSMWQEWYRASQWYLIDPTNMKSQLSWTGPDAVHPTWNGNVIPMQFVVAP